jgi:hypothetical protein
MSSLKITLTIAHKFLVKIGTTVTPRLPSNNRKFGGTAIRPMFHVTISLNNSNICFMISIMITSELLLQVTRCLFGAFRTKVAKNLPISIVMSVYQSACNNSRTTEWIFIFDTEHARNVMLHTFANLFLCPTFISVTPPPPPLELELSPFSTLLSK